MTHVIPHWLDKQAELAPNEQALERPDGSSLTFNELRDNSRQWAKWLKAQGIERYDHVAVLSGNDERMVYLIHALSYIGAVAVLLNARLSQSELAFQIDDADVKLLVCQEDLLQTGTGAATSQSVLVLGMDSFRTLPDRDESFLEEIELDQLATIMYTSGTTGKPKGVMHTYGNHWFSAVASALNLGLHQEDKWLLALPIFHVGGFSVLIKSLIYGMPVYLLNQFDEHVVNRAIYQHGVSIVSVVTPMLNRLMDNMEEREYPHTFRCMLLGGGPAPYTLLEQAKQKKIPVFQTYGMTETSSQIVTLSPKDALEKLGSAGKALSTAQLQIGKGAEPYEIDVIRLKGPMVTKGYYKRPEATEELFQNGYLSSGDVGYLDEEGFLYVVDRRKDLIISGGENIYPAEIENVLLGVEGIIDAGVTGMEDSKWGAVPVAFVVTHKKQMLTAEEVKRMCQTQLARYKVPAHIYFVEELPRNAARKLLRRKLLEIIPKGET
ncbi:o-succinylbenzoate--CoA ligase [Thalassobacillus sp. CUG 92003]|uniref:o-succinylbenzoate--CoA ligase n=1 Tax=Thalassobacillus sp. CUG 92003 TaxID=2736641 RepID=UPI0015E735D7|nr:o-succinylbenzoate--CoA ligase [Thalassobacillus sp. CUG 92003]